MLITPKRPIKNKYSNFSKIANRNSKRLARLKLIWQGTILVCLILLTPFFLESSPSTEIAESNQIDTSLAINSPTFSLNAIALDGDGFVLKNSGQTIAATDKSDLSDIFTYTVEEGDTLSSIAYNFGISVNTIVWENNITNPNNIKPGTQLAILPVDGITHIIASDENLDQIAKEYKIAKDDLITQNQLQPGNELLAGEKLIIAGGKKSMSTTTTASLIPSYAAYNSLFAVEDATIQANAAPLGENFLSSPTQGRCTNFFRAYHYAVDIANRSAPDILAAANGTVIQASYGWNGGYGNVVTVDHGNNRRTLYAHLSEIRVSVGQPIQQGEVVGRMGSTGISTGTHLHFEVILNGLKINPLSLIERSALCNNL